ncbi:hypothetical protein [Paraliomyxa miuraensis]|uniref:hypothetical protein n=1 Tax=Paraliomyxa miuraensis TaxID=376150 RepID=UPI00224E3A03|nr:hypothetical protein [Paraliomyxa miuraensis]MCX4239421.1 hypothetical protein [Paraliomyxa miuraensis]
MVPLMKVGLSSIGLAILIGCAGGRTNLQFNEAKYPISLSPTVLGRDGLVLFPDERTVVGQLHLEAKAWGIAWAAIPLRPNTDLSKELNSQVHKVGGEAVVNLRITSRQCGINHAWILSTIPLWPGCSRITVQGDIIREGALPPKQ